MRCHLAFTGLFTGLVFFAGACAEGTEVVSGGETSAGGQAAGAGSTVGGQAAGGRSSGGDGPAGGSGGASASGGSPSAGGASQGGGGEGQGGMENPDVCAAGSFAMGVDEVGKLICETPDAWAAADASSACSVYWGVRDGCGGCSDPPTKWGRTNGVDCGLGIGADDTCITATLGGLTRPYFGLNTDGDVDENDKFFLGFHCAGGAPVAGSCGPGELLTGWDGIAATCTPTSSFVGSAVGEHCAVYLGWRDQCGGCTSVPSKWGRARSGGCLSGGGLNDTCTAPVLGAATVNLYGLATGGDVNEDDKFYVGFRCEDGLEESVSATGSCPAGFAVTEVAADLTLTCTRPEKAIVDRVKSGCSLGFGWIDSCNGCTSPPSKWGMAKHGACENGAGLDGSCSIATLGADVVSLYGLSPDGDVNDDDKFLIAFSCQ